MALYIGLMSGTSLDGVDAVLADFDASGTPRVVGHEHVAIPAELADELLALNRSGADEVHRCALAAQGLMALYAQAARLACHAAAVDAAAVRALGAHGQTVRHRPQLGYTTQLVNGALLAELTSIDVVCDFRSRDVAAGGQGAPLAPAFHAAMFARSDATTALLNLGGIANITVLAGAADVHGHDTGPGNVLMDHWIREQRGQAFDCDGTWAASGTCDARLLAAMLREPYFAQPPPKSTGRDLFHADWLAHHLNDGIERRPVDVMTTLAELTAVSAAAAVRVSGAAALHICGGGACNAHLMRRLAALLPRVDVASTDALGIAPQQIEGLAFAWLAWAFDNKKAGNLPAVTGARGPRVLGALYPA